MTVNMDTRGMHTEPRTQGTLPHATKPEDLLAEHERGLYLVEQLATTWGTLAPRHHGVYAHLTWDNS